MLLILASFAVPTTLRLLPPLRPLPGCVISLSLSLSLSLSVLIAINLMRYFFWSVSLHNFSMCVPPRPPLQHADRLCPAMARLELLPLGKSILFLLRSPESRALMRGCFTTHFLILCYRVLSGGANSSASNELEFKSKWVYMRLFPFPSLMSYATVLVL